jgi:hypothetical protein
MAKIEQAVARRDGLTSLALKKLGTDTSAGIQDHTCPRFRTHQPSKVIIKECKPSLSSTEAKRALNASSTSCLTSSSSSDSNDLTSGVRTEVKRLLNALPATVTNDARARALKAEIGVTVRVGRRVGKTEAARTY